MDPPHLRGDGGLSTGDVGPRVTERLPPRLDQRVLALVVVLKRGPGAVGLEPVELDEQPCLGVREVDARAP